MKPSKQRLTRFPSQLEPLNAAILEKTTRSTSSSSFYESSIPEESPNSLTMSSTAASTKAPKRIDSFNTAFDKMIKKRTGWKREDPHQEKLRLDKAVHLFESIKNFKNQCRLAKAKELEKKIARQREEIRKYEERKAIRDKLQHEEREREKEEKKKRREVDYNATNGMLNRIHRGVYYHMIRKEKHYVKKGKDVSKLWDKFLSSGKTLDFDETPETTVQGSLSSLNSQDNKLASSSRSVGSSIKSSRSKSSLTKSSKKEKESWAQPMTMPSLPSLSREVGNASYFEEERTEVGWKSNSSLAKKRNRLKEMYDLAKRHQDLSHKLLTSVSAKKTSSLEDSVEEEPWSLEGCGSKIGDYLAFSFDDLKETFDIYGPNSPDIDLQIRDSSQNEFSPGPCSPSIAQSTTPGGLSTYRDSVLSRVAKAPLMGIPEKIETCITDRKSPCDNESPFDDIDPESMFDFMRPVSLPPIGGIESKTPTAGEDLKTHLVEDKEDKEHMVKKVLEDNREVHQSYAKTETKSMGPEEEDVHKAVQDQDEGNLTELQEKCRADTNEADKKIPLTLGKLSEGCSILQPSLKPSLWRVPWSIRQSVLLN